MPRAREDSHEQISLVLSRLDAKQDQLLAGVNELKVSHAELKTSHHDLKRRVKDNEDNQTRLLFMTIGSGITAIWAKFFK